jgi:3,4-dihydroxy-2-butanone 4-phosphate synthase
VQCGHAIWEASKAFSHLSDIHPHFVICEVRDEKRLKHDMDKLLAAGIQLRAFHENDLNNEMTAFATEPIRGEQRHHFRNFQLLKAEPQMEVA